MSKRLSEGEARVVARRMEWARSWRGRSARGLVLGTAVVGAVGAALCVLVLFLFFQELRAQGLSFAQAVSGSDLRAAGVSGARLELHRMAAKLDIVVVFLVLLVAGPFVHRLLVRESFLVAKLGELAFRDPPPEDGRP